jgi:hypothetical protein
MLYDPQYKISRKSAQCGSRVERLTDGRTDMTKLKGVLAVYANEPEKRRQQAKDNKQNFK